MIDVTDATFDEQVMKSDKVVLVDFSTQWCYPCRLLAPILHALEEEYKDRVVFVKVDPETESVTSKLLRVSSVPAIFVYKGGEPKRNFVGLVKEAEIRLALEDLLR
jgi:thioredoxin 1